MLFRTLLVVAIVYLLAAYAIGGPLQLGRVLTAILRRHRARYRGHQDDVLASSRFTIPVSIVLPTGGDPRSLDAIEHLLGLSYADFEVVVVNDGPATLLHEIRDRFGLSACEVFYRRSLSTTPVRAIYRSSDHRLLLVDCPALTRGDALNCGVNLARYRYVCCTTPRARYSREALIEAMRPALEDPALVVGITTSLGSIRNHEPERHDTFAILQRLSSLRRLIARTGGRRLNLSVEGLPGFTLWRRDVVLAVGGFATDVESEHIDLTFRVHRHMLRTGEDYRIVHLSEPVGDAATERTVAEHVEYRLGRQRSIARILWRSRGMIGNPRYGRVGLVDLPLYLFGMFVVPWLELACLVALPFSSVADVLTGRQLALVVLAIALGNAVLLTAAMLQAAPAPTDAIQQRLVLLSPLELFVTRPLQLYSRLVGVLTAMGSASPR
jgi:hypothetical protein